MDSVRLKRLTDVRSHVSALEERLAGSDGRVSEDFKLSTGTWVCVASIRGMVHKYLGDLVADAVVTGHDQDYLGLMLVPGPGMRKLAGA